jgi:hypothetical protein
MDSVNPWRWRRRASTVTSNPVRARTVRKRRSGHVSVGRLDHGTRFYLLSGTCARERNKKRFAFGSTGSLYSLKKMIGAGMRQITSRSRIHMLESLAGLSSNLT